MAVCLATTASSTSPARTGTPHHPAPTEPVAPQPVPDPFAQPSTGTPWCDCGAGHQLTRSRLYSVIAELYGQVPDRIRHIEIIDIAAYLWQYVSVCEFFTGCVADAATQINGEVAADYPLDIGCAILRQFCNHWSGCPDEGCDGHYIPAWARGRA